MGSTNMKCTAHQIPNEFRIAYSAGGNRVEPCLEVVGRSTLPSLCDGSFHSSTVILVHADIGFLDSLLVSLLLPLSTIGFAVLLRVSTVAFRYLLLVSMVRPIVHAKRYA
jgi:hypothetical protein